MKLNDAGERKIVKMITDRFSIPIDDCAVIENGDEYILLTTDILNEEKHFPRGSKPYYVGWYSIAVNMSDIAAKGGEPVAFLSALSMPRDMEMEYMEEILHGMEDCIAEYGGKLVGGDTKESSIMTISITAIGRVEKEKYIGRKGAKVGEGVYVTGNLGKEINLYKGDFESLLHVKPRIMEGRKLALAGAAGCSMDLSDGLASSLHQLAEINNVGFLIEWDRLPVYEKLEAEDALEFALYHGGDFELLFTMAEEYEDMLDFDFTRIGYVVEDGVWLEIDGKKIEIENRGYEHFR